LEINQGYTTMHGQPITNSQLPYHLFIFREESVCNNRLLQKLKKKTNNWSLEY